MKSGGGLVLGVSLLYDASLVIAPKMLDLMTVCPSISPECFSSFLMNEVIISIHDFWGIDLVLIRTGM